MVKQQNGLDKILLIMSNRLQKWGRYMYMYLLRNEMIYAR